MRSTDDIKRAIQKLETKTSDRLTQNTLNDMYAAMDAQNLYSLAPSTWRKIMNSKITKLTTAAVIVAAALIGIYYITGSLDGSSVAFAKVIKQIQNSKYTFDLTVTSDNDISPDLAVMVSEPGQIRIDSKIGLGDVSSIINLQNRKTFLLLHQFKTAQFLEDVANEKENEEFQSVPFFVLAAKPVTNLWNLVDGTEKNLGKKEMNGRKVQGFEVQQKIKDIISTITIWVDIETGNLLLVEINSHFEKDNSPPEDVQWTLTNFNFDVQLDDDLFKMELPAGYTLAYNKTLQEIVTPAEKVSDQVEQIKNMLSAWQQNDQRQAMKLLLDIDFSKPITFSGQPYIFSLTEAEYIALVMADQQTVMKEVISTASDIKKITRHTVDLAKAAIEQKDFASAEKYLTAITSLGKVLTDNQTGLLTGRLVGISMEKFCTKQLLIVYKQTHNAQKLDEAKSRLEYVNATHQKIKDKVAGH